MVAKLWKKVALIILLIACLFNIVIKLVKRVPYIKELETSAEYVYKEEMKEKQ